MENMSNEMENKSTTVLVPLFGENLEPTVNMHFISSYIRYLSGTLQSLYNFLRVLDLFHVISLLQ